MTMSLYVAKSDGDREMLDDVNVDIAREVFARMDWASELAAVRAAQEAGTEIFLPEFGINDDTGRSLVISPLDDGNVSFYLQNSDRLVGAQNFPIGSTSYLIGMFFDGLDEEIAGLAPKPA